MTNQYQTVGHPPGPKRLEALLLEYFNNMRIAPTAALENCGISRAEWTKLKNGQGLSLNSLRKLAQGLSIPLLKLWVASGIMSAMEVANASAPMVQEEIKGAQVTEKSQFWRLSKEEGELIRIYRHISAPRGKDLLRDVAKGQVRLGNFKSAEIFANQQWDHFIDSEGDVDDSQSSPHTE